MAFLNLCQGILFFYALLFYIKVFKLMILNILNLSFCFFLYCCIHNHYHHQPPTLFPTTFPIRYTLCWQFVLHFFRDREKKKIRFWKLFGVKVSFLKSFSCVSFNYTGSSAAKIIHNRKIKTICILNGRERDFVAVLYRDVFDLLY